MTAGDPPARGRPSPAASERENRRRYSISIEIGMAILGCFSADRTEIMTGDIAQTLKTTPGLLKYHLAALRRAGYLVPGRRRSNKIGFRVLDLGMSTQCSLSVDRLAAPYLRELRDRTGLTVVLVIADGDQAAVKACVYRRRSHRGAPDRQIREAQCLPLTCTAAGKAILASLPNHVLVELLPQVLEEHTLNSVTDPRLLHAELQTIRRDGVAYERNEYRPGLNAIAAPLRGDHAEVLGAVSLASTNESTATLKTIEALTATALLLSAHLGFRPGD